MPHRPPFFSMPSVVERLKTLKSDVPKIIKDKAATEVEEYLLDQASFLNQQNIIIAEVLDAVKTQTEITNGRVTEREKVSEAQQITLDEYKSQQKSWHTFLKWFIVFIGVIAVPIAEIFFKWLAMKAGIHFTP